MSNLKEQLEVDIRRFLENIEKQDESDKIRTLRNLFDKYIHLNTSSYLMDAHDLSVIINDAKSVFSEKTTPIHLGSSKRLVYPADLPNYCVIESTIRFLNKKDCLKKLPKFDEREDNI